MRLLRGYNENSFLYSWKEDVKVTLDTILQSLGTCKRYTISSDVSNYLTYIDDEVFYVSPSFEQVKTDNKISTLNPHFILVFRSWSYWKELSRKAYRSYT